MPFINKSEATKRPKDGKINDKCTNGMNRRNRVWPVCLFTSEMNETTWKEPPPLTKRQPDILPSQCLLSDYLQVILQSVPSKTPLLSDLVQCFLTGTQ